MRFLAINLDSLAKGDRAKLLTTGFDLAGEGDGSITLEPITGFKLIDGPNVGELKASVKSVKGAVSYNYEYTVGNLSDDSKWNVIPDSTTECLMSGLPSGERVYVRVAAVGRKKQFTYSNTLSRVVQ